MDVGLVTVPHLKKCMEVLAKASTHGAIFAVTGGDHFTSDDMFKVAKLTTKKSSIEQLNNWKNKKERVVGIERELIVRKILEQGKEIKALTTIELMALLKWHIVAKRGDGKVSERREMRMKILEEGKVAPSFRDWSVEEETALAKLEAEPVSIKDTVLCHLKEQHKRELLATYHAMSDMEKQAFMQELTGGATEGGISEEEEGKREEEDNVK